MWQDPGARYHAKLHRCKQDDHYHIISGIENISWPFWSREAGLKLVDFSIALQDGFYNRGTMSAEELAFQIEEFERIRQEVEALPGLPTGILYQEGNVAKFWSQFLNEQNQCMCYMTQALGTACLLPLYCDFIHRTEPRPIGALSRTGWIRLAEAPVLRNTMEELGITLDPVR